MNEYITERIEQYLELETSYAIILSGDYGIGKTHYVKNELFKIVRRKKLPNDSEKEYKAIHISLFGLKSIEDLQSQIFLELNGLNNKFLKIGAGFGNAVLKGFGWDAFEAFKEAGAASEFTGGYEKVLICLDDIDRKNAELSLDEILGFVNNLVENYNAKILLIAKEEEFYENVSDNNLDYSKMKEKVIGVSIHYEANVSEIYDAIIEKKYSSTEYSEFLKNKKDQIIKFIELNNDNLRNLIFFFEQYKIIYDTVSEVIKSEEKFKNAKIDIEDEVLKFSLPCMIEYKSGRLNTKNYKDVQELYQGIHWDLDDYWGNEVKKEVVKEKTYRDKYKEKYMTEARFSYPFLSTVFDYVVGKNIINLKILKSDLLATFNLENKEMSEIEELFNSLSYINCLNLSPEEYDKKIHSLLKFVDEGELSLQYYIVAFRLAMRFGNPLKFKPDELRERFLNGLQVAITKQHFIDQIYLYTTINPDEDFHDQIQIINKASIEANMEIKNNQDDEKAKKILEIFISDFEKFLEEYEEPSNSDFKYGPLFSHMDFDKLWDRVKGFSNLHLFNFAFFLKERYEKINMDDILPEKPFIEAFKLNVGEQLKSEDLDYLRHFSFGKMDEVLDFIWKRFIKISPN